MADFHNSLNTIKKKLKEDYNFIKNDGAVLSYLANQLLLENESNLLKTIEFIETLSKKEIIARMNKIKEDMETAGEISSIIKEITKKDKQNLIDIENQYSLLETNKLGIERDIKELEKSLDSKQKYDNSLDIQIETKTTELADIESAIAERLYETYEDEFVSEKCDHVLTYDKDVYGYGNVGHIHYLDVEKYSPKVIHPNYMCTYNHNNHLSSGGEKKEIKFCFPINIILIPGEFIIKTYFCNDNNLINEYVKKGKYGQIAYHYGSFDIGLGGGLGGGFIIYITNYGRIIKTQEINFGIDYIQQSSCYGISPRNQVIKLSNAYKDIKFTYYDTIGSLDILNGQLALLTIYKKNTESDFPLIQAPKLIYRLPRIFLDVIDAFHTQNTDLMHECCKKYINITRSKGSMEQIIDNIEFEKIKQEKDKVILERENEIEEYRKQLASQNEEIEKMKTEIAKLKQALLVFTN